MHQHISILAHPVDGVGIGLGDMAPVPNPVDQWLRSSGFPKMKCEYEVLQCRLKLGKDADDVRSFQTGGGRPDVWSFH